MSLMYEEIRGKVRITAKQFISDIEVEMKKISVGKLVNYLLEHIEEIKTVEDWSFSAGYSKSYFTRLVRAQYRRTPEFILRWVRLMKIAKEFHQDPEKICYAVAVDTGLSDDNGLCYFVKRHMGITPGMLRNMMTDPDHYEELLEATSRELDLPLHEFPNLQPVARDKQLVA